MRYIGLVLMMIFAVTVASASPEGDPEALRQAEVAKALKDPAAVKVGEKLFGRCMACHMIGEGAQHRVGPILNGVVGRKAGSAEGYNRYSPSMRKVAADGLVWTVDTLDAYLKNPKAVVNAGTMGFPGLPSAEQRQAVIAYLASFNADGSRVSQ